jgi:hypothetical protein
MSEYHKIETLYERDPETFKIRPGVLKNRVYGLLKSWRWTEKVDGMNMRVVYTASSGGIDNFEAATVKFGGKTNNAKIPGDLLDYMIETFSVEKLTSLNTDASSIVLYGEGYGAGIQKGGDYSKSKKFILFDVLVDGEWWLSDENMRDIAAKLNIETVPCFGKMTLEEATDFVRRGFKSRCAKVNPDKDAEGLVGRPLETLFDKKGHRLIVKLKTKDFAP